MKFASWNVNGVRAAMDKGLREYLQSCDADVICLQEVKAEEHQLDLKWLEGYRVFWNPAVKKGYSGTAVLSRTPHTMHANGMNIPEHDKEGRIITVEFQDFHLVNVYTPNSQNELKRLSYRMKWDEDFRLYLKKLEKSKPVVTCGDFNVAHQEIDIARPKDNRKNAGFTDEERASFTRLLDSGFVDTFRYLDPSPSQYSWWSFRAGARKKNVGWRIDYWLVSEALRPRVKVVGIRQEIHGSDHCPVELVLS